MHLAPIALVALLFPGPRLEAEVPGPGDDLFPQASTDMVIAVGEGGDSWSLADLVREYARLTNQNLQFDQQTAPILETTKIGLTRSAVVPRSEVQSFFEHLLVENQFVLKVIRHEEPRLLTVSSLQTNARNSIRSSATFVPERELARWSAHPSVMITTLVTLPSTDVRQLTNNMRVMITDGNTQLVLPAGSSNSLVLVGFAPWVADMAAMLRIVNEASRVDDQEPLFERIVLRHAVAQEIDAMVEELVRSAYRTVGGQPRGAQAVPAATLSRHADVRVLADVRTNALMVMAMPNDLPKVRRIVELLDVAVD